MADRLADLVLNLQRMAESTRVKGDDLRYMQQQETQEHIAWLDHLLSMVGKVNSVLMDERRKFAPVERKAIPSDEPMPRIVRPKEATG